MQVLADVRRQLHGADEDKEYAEEHREGLEHYRAHFDGLVARIACENAADRLSPEASAARTAATERATDPALVVVGGGGPDRTGGEGASRSTCSRASRVRGVLIDGRGGGDGDDVRGAGHPDVL